MKQTHSIYMEDELWKKLSKEADINKRTVSFIINEILEEWGKKKEDGS